ncbi:DUF4862 family protein [Rothia sp. ZJ932]|uniref:DUF4862 family protein n=1 Tax=Rothia sp. ZJ932 TaxID=2810516 RepID=UPI001F0718B3|nr:DUF4862 family protein [Rothia sp. ZJ932]
MSNLSVPVVVGAYAAMPTDVAEQEEFYAQLAQIAGATALEIPFHKTGLNVETGWLAQQMRGRFTQSIITLIPGTMARVGETGVFGLASTDEGGRTAGLDFVRQAREVAEEINQATGAQSVSALHIHSAPSVKADKQAFAKSLEELLSEDPWSTRLVIEHCDAYSPEIAGEKRFLSLDAEIAAAQQAGLGITVNWGRSAVEAQDGERPSEHLRALVDTGVLEGLMFSGAGHKANQYGGEWADAHLPLTADEPTSLMDAAEVARCLEIVADAPRYVGAKIQAPKTASVDQRIAMISNITQLLK